MKKKQRLNPPLFPFEILLAKLFILIYPLMIFIPITFIGTIIHFLPDENYRRPGEGEIIRDVVPLGRKFALALLFGDKHKMKKLSCECLMGKIEKSNIKNYYLEYCTSPSVKNNVENWRSEYSIRRFLRYSTFDVKTSSKDYFYSQEVETFIEILDIDVKKKMKLITLENKDDFVTITFVYVIDNDGYYDIIELPERGKMIFTVTFAYLPGDRNSFIWRLVRKISNIPLLNLILGKWGTSYCWLCIDYQYNYNLYDYYEWIINHLSTNNVDSVKKIQ